MKRVPFVLLAVALALGSFSPPKATAAGLVSGIVTGPDGSTRVPQARVGYYAGEPSNARWSMVFADSQGDFVLGVLPAGDYYVVAIPPSGSPYAPSLPNRVKVEGSPTVIHLKLTALSIVGRVVAPDGSTPVPMAPVSVRTADRASHRGAMSNQEGNFVITGLLTGTYVLEALPPMNQPGLTPAEPLTVTIPGISQTVNAGDIALTRPSITGTVLGPGGLPLRMVRVGVRSSDLTLKQETATHSDGTFVFGGLPTGGYTVTVHALWDHPELIPPAPRGVNVESGTTAHAGVFQFQSARQHVVGNVFNRDGGPVTSAIVVANKQDGSGYASSPVTTTRTYSYSLDVTPGAWMVNIVPDRRPGAPPPDWIYTGSPILVSLDGDLTTPITRQVDITVTATNAAVRGRLSKPDSSSFEPRSAFVSAHDERGFVNGSGIDAGGNFFIPLRDGAYRLVIELRDETLMAPSGLRFAVAPNETKDLGDIHLSQKNSRINGQVVDGAGQGVSGIEVRAWRRGEMGIAGARTITDGLFSLTVVSGTWEVTPLPGRDSRYIAVEPPLLVQVTDNETKTVELHVVAADATIEGRVVEETTGEVVDDLAGYATALQGRKAAGGAPIRNGLFTIYVPSGFYTITAGFPPGAAYVLNSNVTATLSPGETENITLTVARNDSTITGRLENVNNFPQTGVNATIFAGNGEGSHAVTRVNPHDATYTMSVTADTWRMHAATDPGSDFVVRPRFDNTVTVAQGGTATFDFTVVQLSSILSGTVTISGTVPVTSARVFVDEMVSTTTSSRFRKATRTDSQGRYRLHLPAGTYRLRSEAPPDLGLIAPAAVTVTLQADAALERDLVYRVADAEIVGTVTLSGTAASALVWGYSDSGGRSWFRAEDGSFRLRASLNETWHIGAGAEKDGMAFSAGSITVIVEGTSPVTQDLTLLPWRELPESQSVSFEASAMQIIRLSDGTEIQIPAGAMALSGTVTVRAAPKALLVREQARRPIGLAYALSALDGEGQSISTFNQNVAIVIPYTDEQLGSLGLTEDDLVPSYWDEVTGTWQRVDNVLVDKANNKVTLIVDHFTDYALTGSPSGLLPYTVYLPAVLRYYSGGW